MSLRDVDHTLYNEYKSDPMPEHFQKYFLQWYEAGGIMEQSFSQKLQALLCDLRERYTWDQISEKTSLASKKSLITHASAVTLGEETSKNIYMNLKERL